METKLDLNKPFRIIGVQVLSATDEAIRKVLFPGWYPLIKCTSDIGVTNDLPVIDKDACPVHYYRQKEVAMPIVTVCAIVGKNGAGKSSLVDIIYRILNNFAETLLLTPQGADHCDTMEYVSGIHARLYFELDGVLKFIECCDSETFYYIVEKHCPVKVTIRELSDHQIKEILRGFFYTISINYSLYAFNSADDDSTIHDCKKFIKKSKWIDCLFHKNDGYYIPLVLTPFREEGQIDINNENNLAEQRLSTLSLLFHSQGKEFLDEYVPMCLKFAFRYNYKEEKLKMLYEHPLVPELGKVQEFLINHLQEAWTKILLEEEKIKLDPLKNQKHEIASFYLAYKTLKICSLYSDYKDAIPFEYLISLRDPVYESNKSDEKVVKKDRDGKDITIISVPQCISWADDNAVIFNNLARNLNNSPVNHITAKLHQTVEYLRNDRYAKDTGTLDIDDVILCHKRYDNYDDVMMLLPPPFFFSELCFFKKGTVSNENLITFARMSSGERQMYYSLSYVFYHIRNIAGIKERVGRTVKYHHINLIFDEAELYYHPEYQRKFVSKLLSGLALCHINKKVIRSINVIIITHSPFILSDIPDTNILLLGRDIKNAECIKTLGANIYDLLKGGFFLDYAIGDFIQAKLQTYLEIYNDSTPQRIDRFEKIKDEMSFIIKHLGEKYLRAVFQRMYDEMSSPDKEDDIKSKIRELQLQQAILESKLKKE